MMELDKTPNNMFMLHNCPESEKPKLPFLIYVILENIVCFKLDLKLQT